MIKSKDYDFSFSGLKTAVLYNFKKRPKKQRVFKEYIRAMAQEIQQAIIDVLNKKTIKAVKNHQAKSILLGGGVVANKELRKQLKEKIKEDYNQRAAPHILIPDIKFCTDNAAMTGVTGYFNYRKKKKNWPEIKVAANLRIS
jgi:N6-L-threonylcarbamoyladenine synthase